MIPARLVSSVHTRLTSRKAPPARMSPAPPSTGNLSGAVNPNCNAAAISPLGSEKPSCAHRNGSTSSSVKLLQHQCQTHSFKYGTR